MAATSHRGAGRLLYPNLQRLFYTFLGVIVMLAVVFPFLWIALSSLRGVEDFFSLELSGAFPKSLDLTSYELAFGRSQLTRWVANSLGIASGTTLLSLTVSAPAAFAIARLRFRGRNGGRARVDLELCDSIDHACGPGLRAAGPRCGSRTPTSRSSCCMRPSPFPSQPGCFRTSITPFLPIWRKRVT